MKRKINTTGIGCNPHGQLLTIGSESLAPFPDGKEMDNSPAVKSLTKEQRNNYECSLDGIVALRILKPKTKEEENNEIKQKIKEMHK